MGVGNAGRYTVLWDRSVGDLAASKSRDPHSPPRSRALMYLSKTSQYMAGLLVERPLLALALA